MAWKHACSSPPRKFRIIASTCKVMTSVFWDAEGTVLTDYLEHSSTITNYADLVGKLRTALKEKRLGKLWCGVPFHQDNAHVRTSSQVLAAIQNAGFELLRKDRHPSYLPELTPVDFYFFSKLKEFTKECKFTDNEYVTCAKKWPAGRARSTILLQWNSSFGEKRDQVPFSCRRLC